MRENLFIGVHDIINYMQYANWKTKNLQGISETLFTKRELEVLFYSLQNLSSNEVAQELGFANKTVISKNTIANIKRNIIKKMGCHNLSSMNQYSYLLGLNLYCLKTYYYVKKYRI